MRRIRPNEHLRKTSISFGDTDKKAAAEICERYGLAGVSEAIRFSLRIVAYGPETLKPTLDCIAESKATYNVE